MDILLTIIIPMYNTEKYTRELLDCLKKQMNDAIEIIVVDNSTDIVSETFSSDYPIRYIQTERQCGASKARNIGLDLAQGKYISFIDSDDMINDKYVEIILNKIKYSPIFDYCFMSWKWFGSINDAIIITDVCPDWNWSVWNRIWRRDFIGDKRFNEKRNYAEDSEFIMNVIGSNTYSDKKKENIKEIMYMYRVGRNDNISTLYGQGKLKEYRE